MKFDVYGPFEIPRGERGTIVDTHEFWDSFKDEDAKLANACGCYVFAIGATDSYKPWYVGKTENAFKSEALQDNKIKIYNRVLDKRSRGKPVLFLLPQITKGNKFAKGDSDAIVGLENILIAQAITRNSEMENISKTRILRGVEVVGFMNTSGRAKESALKLRKTFGVKKAFGG